MRGPFFFPIVAAVSLILLSFPAVAQKKTLHVIPEIDLGFTPTVNEPLDPPNGLFYKPGVCLNYMLTDRVGLLTGICLARYRYNVYYRASALQKTFVQKSSYLELPFGFHFDINRQGGKKRTWFYMNVGCALDIRLQGRYSGKLISYQYTDTEVDNTEELRSLLVRPFFGFGLSWWLTDKMDLLVGPQFSIAAARNIDRNTISYDNQSSLGVASIKFGCAMRL